MVNGFFVLHHPEACMRNNNKIIKNGSLWNAARNSLDGLSELIKESAARREIFLIVACALVFGFMPGTYTLLLLLLSRACRLSRARTSRSSLLTRSTAVS